MKKLSSVFIFLVWLVPLVGVIYAVIYFNNFHPESAPQQAALAAMTLVYCIVPYIFARAIQEIIISFSKKEEQ